jgi:hypothetical protein
MTSELAIEMRLKHFSHFQNITSFGSIQFIINWKKCFGCQMFKQNKTDWQSTASFQWNQDVNAHFRYLILMYEKDIGAMISFNGKIFWKIYQVHFNVFLLVIRLC